MINGEHLANVQVSRRLEAEFDHWSDEEIDFPPIRAGDELLIRYGEICVLKGVFKAE